MTAFDPLRQFLAESLQCTTKTALSGVAISTMRRVFNTHVGVVMLLDHSLSPIESSLHGTRDSQVEEYNQQWRDTDPVLAMVIERRVPVHCRQLHTAEAWRRLPIVTNFGRQVNTEHYMIAPIYGCGTLIGILHFCRRPHDRSFGVEELTLAMAFCGFLSSSFASLPRASKAQPVPLTLRERQIALLAGQGENNLKIALRLGIARETVKQTLRRVYRKLNVGSRVEMAANFAARGWL